MTLDPKTWVAQFDHAFTSPEKSQRGQITRLMVELAEACGNQLRTPNFGIQAAIKAVFQSDSIPKHIDLIISNNPNSAKQAFHAAKLKVLRQTGKKSDLVTTRMHIAFRHAAKNLYEIGELNSSLKEILDTYQIDPTVL